LLNSGTITCPSCSAFFNADPIRVGYFGELTDAVTRQVPYDGRQSNISLYDAGAYSPQRAANQPNAANILKNTPMCGYFVEYRAGSGITVNPTFGNAAVAESQITAPQGAVATDVYINTDKQALTLLNQGTILHEALHNLTGLEDFVDTFARQHFGITYDLKQFVGIETTPGVNPSSTQATTDITNQLQKEGCANAN